MYLVGEKFHSSFSVKLGVNELSWRIGNGKAQNVGIGFSLRECSLLDFPDSSVGEESTCNAGDPHSIPGSGRSARKGTGYPLQYS